MNLGNISNITKIIPPNGTILKDFPPDIVNALTDLIFLLKAAGVIFIIYVLFLVISSIMGIVRSIRMKKMYNKVNDINDKLDLIMKKEKIKIDTNKK